MTTPTDSSAVDTEVHGAFSFLDAVFINEPDIVDSRGRELVRVEKSTSATSRRTWRRRLAGVLGAAKAALAVVRGAVRWLIGGPRRAVQRHLYTGRHNVNVVRHRVQRTVLGRERSSYEYAGIVQQRSRGERTEEGDLAFQHGDTFVSWVALTLDALRYYESTCHPEGRHKFICS